MFKANSVIDQLKTAKEIIDFFKTTTLTKSDLGVSKSTWNKYMCIKKCDYFLEVVDILPPKTYVLYNLSILGKESFKKALEEGIVSPQTTTRKLLNWKKSEKENKNSFKVVTMAISVPSDYDEKKIELLVSKTVESVGRAFRVKTPSSSQESILLDLKKARLEKVKAMSTGSEADEKALKYAHDSLYSESKGSRYRLNVRLSEMAKGGNVLAQILTSDNMFVQSKRYNSVSHRDTNMLITNFTANKRDLFVLWDGKANVKAWTDIRSIPSEYLELARYAKRVPITSGQWEILSKEFDT